MKRAVAGITAALLCGSANANYFGYSEWLALSENSRGMYIAGAYDSLISYATSDEGARVNMHFRDCIVRSKMTNIQFARNVAVFASTRPKLHTEAVQIALIQYLHEACGAPPK